MQESKQIISFEAPEHLKEQLRLLAFEQHCSVSKLIRKILEAAIVEYITKKEQK